MCTNISVKMCTHLFPFNVCVRIQCASVCYLHTYVCCVLRMYTLSIMLHCTHTLQHAKICVSQSNSDKRKAHLRRCMIHLHIFSGHTVVSVFILVTHIFYIFSYAIQRGTNHDKVKALYMHFIYCTMYVSLCRGTLQYLFANPRKQNKAQKTINTS